MSAGVIVLLTRHFGCCLTGTGRYAKISTRYSVTDHLAFLLVDLLLVDLLLVAPLAVAPLAVDLLLVVRLSTVHARCRRRCTCRKSESGRTDP